MKAYLTLIMLTQVLTCVISLPHSGSEIFASRYDLDHHIFISSGKPMYHRKFEHERIKRRSYAEPLVISSNPDPLISDVSFHLNFECSSITVTNLNGSLFCEKAQQGFLSALSRLSRILIIKSTITINATFESFCTTRGDCTSSTLGNAAPSSWYTFTNPEIAASVGADATYMYPSALARQFDASSVDSNRPDISARFNADVAWIIGGVEWGVTTNGNRFDFEQIALHEVLHGLGFLSGW